MQSRVFIFRPSSAVLIDQNFQKVLLVLTGLVFQFHMFYLYLLHFFVEMSNDNFLLESDFPFLKIEKLIPYIKIGMQIDQKWQSAISIEKSLFSNFSFPTKSTHFRKIFRFLIDVDNISNVCKMK